MSEYKTNQCPRCLVVKRVRLRSGCDTCYKKARAAQARPCAECGTERPLTQKEPALCHTCYERARRAHIREQAASDPVLRAKERDRSLRHYIKQREKGRYSTVSRRISSAVNAYKARDPDSEITPEWLYANVVGMNCYYCGLDDDAAKVLTRNYLHVDRKDPAAGYRQANCVPACKICNSAKLDILTAEQMKVVGAAVAEALKLKGEK